MKNRDYNELILMRQSSTRYFIDTIGKFKEEIPEALNDDKSLSKCGKSYSELLKEVEELKNYIEYLKSWI